MFTIEKIKVKFWPFVKKTKHCWVWTGSIDGHGYGRIGVEISRNPIRKRLTTGAHRASYWLHYGEPNKSLHCLHKCDNPVCVRPDHLFLGTQADNISDMIKKGRHARGKKVANFGKKNGFYGKTHSPEVIAKIIASNKRRAGETRSIK